MCHGAGTFGEERCLGFPNCVSAIPAMDSFCANYPGTSFVVWRSCVSKELSMTFMMYHYNYIDF